MATLLSHRCLAALVEELILKKLLQLLAVYVFQSPIVFVLTINFLLISLFPDANFTL